MPSVIITNFGTNTLTSATITWSLNGGADTTINYTGSLAQSQSEAISLGVITLNTGENTFTANISQVNGSVDENSFNDSNVTNYSINQDYSTQQVLFALTTDDYASETSWEFRDATGAVLYSSAGQTYANNTSYNEVFDVASDQCYSFVLNDSYGDGICCGFGQGSYELTTDDGTVIFSGGNFGASEETEISVLGSLSTDEFSLSQMVQVYPNPTKDGFFNIKLNNNVSGDLSYTLISTTGQIIKQGSLQNNENRVSVNNLNSGFYFLSIKDNRNEADFVTKLVIN